ncbi:MAG: heavy-metal-associated domain-containing protein [Candidatus Coatesbacteria bacterium]|nr:heavy-metal-associated domain-containing protein [Candidatus Coatesbacteria bacterium]
MPWMLPGYARAASAIVLLSVLGWSIYSRQRVHLKLTLEGEEGRMLKLNITGMTCSHCVGAVTRALQQGAGVESVSVNLKTGKAVLGGKDLDAEALCAEVRKLGYGCGLGAEPEKRGE